MLLEDRLNFNSLYHYSICLENRTIHLYFDGQGKLLKSTIKDELNNTKPLSEFLSSEEQIVIDEFIDRYVLPVMNQVYVQQSTIEKPLKSKYQKSLDNINKQLYEHSEKIVENLRQIKSAIKLGEKILYISSKSNSMKKSFSSLKNTLERLQKINQISSFENEIIEPAMPKVDKEHDKSEELKEVSLPVVLNKPNEQESNTAIQKFNETYAAVQTHWIELNETEDI